MAAILTLAGVACALNYGTLYSDITPWLAERFTKYIFEMDSNPRYARIIRMIQEEVFIDTLFENASFLNV